MKTIRLALTAAVLVIAGASTSATADTHGYIPKPAWKAAPSRSDVNAVLLDKAKGLHETVDVSVSCQLNPDGSLTACGRVIGPKTGGGIADAALALTAKFVAYVPNEVALMKVPIFVDVAFHFDPSDQPAAPIELADPEFRMVVGATPIPYQFPDAAMKAGYKSGLGVVECDGTATGALVGCSVVSETPTSLGFGHSALSAAKTMNLNPWQRGEPMAGSRVRIPIYINAPGAGGDSTFTRQAIFHVPPGGPGTAGPYFPDRALRMGVNGSAAIQCLLAADGSLSECVTISESAPDFGFALASLKMVQRRAITAAPRIVDDHPVKSETVQVVVPFIADPNWSFRR